MIRPESNKKRMYQRREVEMSQKKKRQEEREKAKNRSKIKKTVAIKRC